MIALANAGGDTVNAIKQAAEYKPGREGEARRARVRPAGVASLGLQGRPGPDSDECILLGHERGTRAWARRYQQRHPKKMMPNHMQAGVYSAVMHYLQGVEKADSA